MAPPWNSPFLPFSTLPSYLPAFASSSRTACARSFALARPVMAAGPVGRAASPRRLGAGMAFASAELGQEAMGRSPCQAAALSLRSGRAGQVWPWAG